MMRRIQAQEKTQSARPVHALCVFSIVSTFLYEKRREPIYIEGFDLLRACTQPAVD